MMKHNSSLACLAQASHYIVDDRVGVIHQLDEVRVDAGSPNFFHFRAQPARTSVFGQPDCNRTSSAARDREMAAARAVSQSVAGYCAALHEKERYPLSTSAELSLPHVPPDQFALYSSKQYQQLGFPWLPFEEQTPVRWIGAIDPIRDEVVQVPAAMVFYPYDYVQGSGEGPIAAATATGLDCRCSPAAAAVSALCQVIEQDALAIVWQAQLAPPQLRIETLSDENYELVARFEKVNSAVTLLNITLDLGVPTVLAVLRSESAAASALVFASAAELDPELAVRHSLENLARAQRLSQQIQTNVTRLALDPSHENILTQVDHLNFWCDHENVKGAEFLFASKMRYDFDELESLAKGNDQLDLNSLSSRISEAGYRGLLVDLSTADLRKLGLTVVRALIPSFHPLFMGYNMRSLGGTRLWEVPARCGFASITPLVGDNSYPHPYLREEPLI
jgi:ribosomal protein S12 methylthiotransferase accessory factor